MGDCNALRAEVLQGPVTVRVAGTGWKDYGSGIFTNCDSKVNHAVLLVGFSQEGNWIVKNSWGPDWGEQGYIQLWKFNNCEVCANGGARPLSVLIQIQ